MYRGVDKEGKRVQNKIFYSPSLFVPAKRITNYTTLHGEYLERKTFSTIRQAKEFIEQFNDVSNAIPIFGNQRFEYAFIADNFKDHINYDTDKVLIDIIDIEVGSENGFPNPHKAEEPITAICIRRLNGGTHVFGCGIFEPTGSEIYHKCRDEWSLCKKFLEYWSKNYPDIVTGWNIKFFDIPYIYNRFKKILGEEDAKKLSPWNYVSSRETKTKYSSKKKIIYGFSGIATIDYQELYTWYAPEGKQQEDYKLNTICNVELGIGKMSYDEYDSLHQLYKLNHQKYIEYNIIDVDLIEKLEDKHKLLEMIIALAFDMKSNFEDVFAQTRMWDSRIYSYLLNKNIIVPPRDKKEKEEFKGAYVKEVLIGLHKWVVSFDLKSMYPHLMMMYNISPETLVEPKDYDAAMRQIISEGVSVEKMLEKKIDTSKLVNVCLTPNGQFFRTDIKGFMAEMMFEMFEDRVKNKTLMLQAEQEKVNEPNLEKKKEIGKRVSKYKNIQLAKKESLVSAYGVLGSIFFRFFDIRTAAAVTQTGALSIQWIVNKFNGYMNNLLKTNNDDYVIASDTDSMYLKFEPLLMKVYHDKLPGTKVIDFMDRVCESQIQPFIEKSFQELADYTHAYAQKMSMKRETLCDKGLWAGKKHYILNVWDSEGVRYNEPEQKVVGLEMVKSSTPALIRKKMKETIKIIMNGTEPEVQTLMKIFKKEFKAAIPEDMSFPRGINVPLKTYSDDVFLCKKGTPIHVRGAILYNKMIKEMKLDHKYPLISEGEKIKFIYLKLPNPFKENVISFPGRLPKEFGLEPYIDSDTQYEKTFVEPIQAILNCMDWSTEKRNTLFD